ncbi:T9SS type A sorting domain-containing protein [Winogradskyella maritima]|uniref:T9SS type A sorting domain-containing protein n=1 Tax=Winogradskyella maritima TaxID=1517766 RepID=A0ABV8AEM0_9FLAO|nr:T9SS type A sorting domain-containing protein [Winogradskyella maritima]
MKKITLLVALIICSVSLSAQQNVTFSVDMTPIAGTFTTVEVNATFNGFCGGCNPLTDQGGNIWEVTLPLNDGTYEYKFTINGGATYETHIAQDVCTVTNFGFTNRTLEVDGADIVLPTAPWEGCAEDLSNPGPHDITFEVDMSSYMPSFTTVYVVGEFNGFDGTANALTDQGSGIWSTTLSLDEKSWQYKFAVDNYTDDEQFAQGDPNTASSNGPCAAGICTNRYIQLSENLTVSSVWENSAQTVLDIEGFVLSESISVSSNPATANWELKTNSMLIQNIELYDILGKKVQTLAPNDTEVSIDATQLKAGIYLAKVSTDLGSKTLKLVKQ